MIHHLIFGLLAGRQPSLHPVPEVCLTGVALACLIQAGYSPSIWVHLFTALPPVLLICLLPLRPLKGWLMNSRFCMKAEAEGIDRDHVRLKRRNHTQMAIDIDTYGSKPTSN
ncbi:DUF983 domain-containing protein [Agrobacterium sp. 22-209-1]